MKLTINNLGDLILDVPSDLLAYSFYGELRDRYFNTNVSSSTPLRDVDNRKERANIFQAIDGANALMQSGVIKSVCLVFGGTKIFIGRKDKKHE